MDAIDPTRKQKAKALQQAKQILSRLGIRPQGITLNEYEMVIASNLVEPRNIDVTWKDIVGLDEVVEELRETVLLPITKSEIFAKSQLIKPPKGVLLHGPPGNPLKNLT
jgi:ATP-dependent 26S proteasome regulatory subunit